MIVADWRLHIAYQHVSKQYGYQLPNQARLHAVIRSLIRAESIEPFDGISGIYRVIVPYASILPAPDELVLAECHPTAVLSFASAVAYHGWTNEIPATLYLTHYDGWNPERLALGTSSDDWVDAPKPRRRMPDHIGKRKVVWTKMKPDWDMGSQIGYLQGMPIYVTDHERTLLDILRFPDKCGGPLLVLRTWRRAMESIDLNQLVDYVDRFEIKLLKQRVGFLLEHLGYSHPKLDNWAANSSRGGSAKLIVGADFCETYSHRWNLSLNIPDAMLAELIDD